MRGPIINLFRDYRSTLACLAPHHPNPAFANGLNVPGIFTGTIIDRENIVKTSEELVAMWNEAYPDDQIVFSEN